MRIVGVADTALERSYCFTHTNLAAHLAASHGGYTPADAAPSKASLAMQAAQRMALILWKNDPSLVPCRKALLQRQTWVGCVKFCFDVFCFAAARLAKPDTQAKSCISVN
jgi:hypothetical protein